MQELKTLVSDTLTYFEQISGLSVKRGCIAIVALDEPPRHRQLLEKLREALCRKEMHAEIVEPNWEGPARLVVTTRHALQQLPLSRKTHPLVVMEDLDLYLNKPATKLELWNAILRPY